MRILALDSSGLTASVAVVEDEQILFEYTMNYKKTHSQTLLPMLDEAVRMTGLSLDTVDAIAVAGGPGSFTGLRIGSATAKGLGLALVPRHYFSGLPDATAEFHDLALPESEYPKESRQPLACET